MLLRKQFFTVIFLQALKMTYLLRDTLLHVKLLKKRTNLAAFIESDLFAPWYGLKAFFLIIYCSLWDVLWPGYHDGSIRWRKWVPEKNKKQSMTEIWQTYLWKIETMKQREGFESEMNTAVCARQKRIQTDAEGWDKFVNEGATEWCRSRLERDLMNGKQPKTWLTTIRKKRKEMWKRKITVNKNVFLQKVYICCWLKLKIGLNLSKTRSNENYS